MTLTPSAVEQLRAMLDQPDPKLIKVGVRNRGCSGLAYHLEYVEKPGAFDEAVEQDGVKVLIDSKALFSIIGSEMDWAEDKLNQRFVFRNPNISMSFHLFPFFSQKNKSNNACRGGMRLWRVVHGIRAQDCSCVDRDIREGHNLSLHKISTAPGRPLDSHFSSGQGIRTTCAKAQAAPPKRSATSAGLRHCKASPAFGSQWSEPRDMLFNYYSMLHTFSIKILIIPQDDSLHQILPKLCA